MCGFADGGWPSLTPLEWVELDFVSDASFYCFFFIGFLLGFFLGFFFLPNPFAYIHTWLAAPLTDSGFLGLWGVCLCVGVLGFGFCFASEVGRNHLRGAGERGAPEEPGSHPERSQHFAGRQAHSCFRFFHLPKTSHHKSPPASPPPHRLRPPRLVLALRLVAPLVWSAL